MQEWLKEWASENGVTLLDWPAYSPDLNPIENVWKLLKERISDKYPELASLPKSNQSLDALCRAAIDIWEDFEEDLLNRLVLGMRKRLKAVIKAKGWYTKY